MGADLQLVGTDNTSTKKKVPYSPTDQRISQADSGIQSKFEGIFEKRPGFPGLASSADNSVRDAFGTL